VEQVAASSVAPWSPSSCERRRVAGIVGGDMRAAAEEDRRAGGESGERGWATVTSRLRAWHGREGREGKGDEREVQAGDEATDDPGALQIAVASNTRGHRRR
jgi:hypothetical protein